ncbi:hypothetical protein [Dongia sp.]|uniref:hypothetical protein n=1 Tax=Dongia sp. TaxID=1977262 RepID=UPI0035B335BF
MTLPAFVELAIGLSFLYMMLAILSSSLLEYLAAKHGWRGRCMRAGLRRLLEDRWIYMAVIRHPTVAALYRDEGGRFPPPSYMPPENFAEALLDVLLQKAIELAPGAGLARGPQQTIGSYRQAAQICADAGYASGGAAIPLLDHAGSVEEAKVSLGKWYDTTMNRISGNYKRDSQQRLFWIGLAVALLLNVDSIAVTAQLLKSSGTRSALADLAATTLCTTTEDGIDCELPASAAPEDLKQVKEAVSNAHVEMGRLADAGLPIGYACLGGVKSGANALTDDLAGALDSCRGYWQQAAAVTTAADGSVTGVSFNWAMFGELIFRIVGWLITAGAISFGAEFWFGLATKFINLRGSGPKPKAMANGS